MTHVSPFHYYYDGCNENDAYDDRGGDDDGGKR